MSRKYKYLHTINNFPAFFHPIVRQICYITTYDPGILVDTLQQIRKEQKLTFKNRKEWGFNAHRHDYGYVRIYI